MSKQRSETLREVALMAVEQTQWRATTVDGGIQFSRSGAPAKTVLWLLSELEINRLVLDLRASAQEAFGSSASGKQLLSVFVLEALETTSVDDGILRRTGHGFTVDPAGGPPSPDTLEAQPRCRAVKDLGSCPRCRSGVS